MATLVYALCALTSCMCLAFLWRSWSATHSRLLFWSAMCFLFLALGNVLLVLDKVVFPDVDMRMWRMGAAFAAVLLLLFGLIWGEE